MCMLHGLCFLIQTSFQCISMQFSVASLFWDPSVSYRKLTDSLLLFSVIVCSHAKDCHSTTRLALTPISRCILH